MMKDPLTVPIVTGILTPDHFYNVAHRLIYKAILSLIEKHQPVEIKAVVTQLQRDGKIGKGVDEETVWKAYEEVITTAYAESDAKIILEKYILRQLAAFGSNIHETCSNGSGSLEDLWEKIDLSLIKIRNSSLLNKKRTVISVNMADVQPEAIDWLWYPLIPKGTVTIIQGKPGIGKSWATLVIATIVSRGWAFPQVAGIPNQAREPGNVILMAGEDMLAKTVRPRLDQAGADVNRICALKGIHLQHQDPDEEGEILLTDVLDIEEKIVELKASLLIVDPIQAYVASDTKMNEQNQMRAITKKIGRMAERHNCSVVMIQHERKGGGSPEKRGLGSIDIFAQARSALMVAPDPDDSDQYDPSHFVIAQIKHNLTPPGEAKAIGYHLSKADGFLWTGPKTITIERLIEEPGLSKVTTNKDRATEFLNEILSHGPRASAEIIELASREGITQRTLERAKSALGIESRHLGKIWVWAFKEPESPETAETDEFPPIDIGIT